MSINSNAKETKASFLWKNLLRGLIWFAFIMTVYVVVKDRLQFHFQSYAETVGQTPILQFIIFGLSELLLGLIPPEFFMIVSILQKISLIGYIKNLIIYTLISYAAGIGAYSIGRRFSRSQLYNRMSTTFLKQYEEKIKKYGSYLVFVGAVTPVPFSATCLLAGSVKMPFRLFLAVSSYRIIRFAVYGWLVWKFPIWFA